VSNSVPSISKMAVVKRMRSAFDSTPISGEGLDYRFLYESRHPFDGHRNNY
jgi:hypothetical protein